MTTQILKKNGLVEEFNGEKIIVAIGKSAERSGYKFSPDEENEIVDIVKSAIENSSLDVISVPEVHRLVEKALDTKWPDVAKTYRDYRNYKQDFVHIMDEVLKMNQSIMYLADKSNANTDSALTSTKRCLLYKKLSKELYQKVFLKPDEVQTIKDGYIYIHDITDRLHCSHNCCVVDFSKLLENGFELANIKYGRPQRITSAIGSVCDIALTTSAQQYGGFTIAHLDKVMSPYIEMTYNAYYNEFVDAFQLAGYVVDNFACEQMAMKKVKKDVLNAVQSMELKFNTLSSSRGDFSFITVTFGLGTDRWAKMFSEALLEVRQKGQGNPPVPVLFPKLVFMTDPKNLHGEGKPNRDLFLKACECSNVCMYPDYISLLYTPENENYLGQVYEKYGKAISPMGCRAFLSPLCVNKKTGEYSFKMEDPEEWDFIVEGRYNLGRLLCRV